MQRLREFDDMTLAVSSMQSAISVGLERLQEIHSKLSELEAEKKDLQVALDVSNQKLKEEVDRNTGLVAELDMAMAKIYRLKAEIEAQEKWAGELEATSEKQKVELEATLEMQKAELEAKLKAKTDTAFTEGVAEATTLYEAQVFNVSQEMWELGWMAALNEARVLEDYPAYKSPPKFPSSDLGLTSAPSPSTKTEAHPKVAAIEAAQTEADANIEAAT
ncbi:hypothetical protein AAC387_Pa02g3762 [Persea americana]